MAQWTDPSRTFLIQEIRSRRIIWDKESTNDTNIKTAKLQAFTEVTSLMNDAFPSSTNYTCEDIRSQWKNLKDTFVRKLRYINEGKYAYDSQKEPTWKFYKMLSFLDDTKKKNDSNGNDHPIFDISALQREHGLDLVKSEIHPFEHSNQSASSTEEQMLSLFAQSYKEKTPVPPDTPPSPSLPRVSHVLQVFIHVISILRIQNTPTRENIVGSSNSGTKLNDFSRVFSSGGGGGSGDEDDEPRRKKSCHRHSTRSPHSHDDYEIFGQLIAAQLRRTAEEHSRGESLRLQKRLNDVLFEAQMALLDRHH